MKNLKKASVCGFCDGVDCAIAKVERARRENFGQVYLDGELVHNDIVNASLFSRGIKILTKEDELNLSAQDTVVIRAHGVTPQRRRFLKSLPAKIVDATCKHVAKIAALIRKNSDRFVLFLGDKSHVEVEGLVGYARSFFIGSSADELVSFLKKNSRLHQKYIMVCQSTFDIDLFENVAEKIQNFANENKLDIIIENTICESTFLRQKSLEELHDCHAVIVVGGKSSANTRRLVEKIQRWNIPCFQINSAQEALALPLDKFSKVGIISGASTPLYLVEEIMVELFRNFSLKNTKD